MYAYSQVCAHAGASADVVVTMRVTWERKIRNLRTTDRPSDRPTDRPTGRPTGRSTDRPPSQQTENPSEERTDGPTDDRSVDRSSDCSTDRPTKRPTARPTSRPTDPSDHRSSTWMGLSTGHRLSELHRRGVRNGTIVLVDLLSGRRAGDVRLSTPAVGHSKHLTGGTT